MSIQHGQQDIAVRISSADSVLWEGAAVSISSENETGRFDVLPGHANFITMIEGKPIIVRTPAGEKTFEYRNAVLYVTDGEVKIFTGV